MVTSVNACQKRSPVIIQLERKKLAYKNRVIFCAFAALSFFTGSYLLVGFYASCCLASGSVFMVLGGITYIRYTQLFNQNNTPLVQKSPPKPITYKKKTIKTRIDYRPLYETANRSAHESNRRIAALETQIETLQRQLQERQAELQTKTENEQRLERNITGLQGQIQELQSRLIRMRTNEKSQKKPDEKKTQSKNEKGLSDCASEMKRQRDELHIKYLALLEISNGGKSTLSEVDRQRLLQEHAKDLDALMKYKKFNKGLASDLIKLSKQYQEEKDKPWTKKFKESLGAWWSKISTPKKRPESPASGKTV